MASRKYLTKLNTDAVLAILFVIVVIVFITDVLLVQKCIIGEILTNQIAYSVDVVTECVVILDVK